MSDTKYNRKYNKKYNILLYWKRNEEKGIKKDRLTVYYYLSYHYKHMYTEQ